MRLNWAACIATCIAFFITCNGAYGSTKSKLRTSRATDLVANDFSNDCDECLKIRSCRYCQKKYICYCENVGYWVDQSNDNAPSNAVPSNAVRAGWDLDGGAIYVGRAHESNNLLPAKCTPNHGCAFVALDGKEIIKLKYQFLCSDKNDICWTQKRGSKIPMEAIPVGKSNSGEVLFMGRGSYEGTLTPGKVQPSDGRLIISWKGGEIAIDKNYEIMVACE